jgi:hypothetical protein
MPENHALSLLRLLPSPAPFAHITDALRSLPIVKPTHQQTLRARPRTRLLPHCNRADVDAQALLSLLRVANAQSPRPVAPSGGTEAWDRLLLAADRLRRARDPGVTDPLVICSLLEGLVLQGYAPATKTAAERIRQFAAEVCELPSLTALAHNAPDRLAAMVLALGRLNRGRAADSGSGAVRGKAVQLLAEVCQDCLVPMGAAAIADAAWGVVLLGFAEPSAAGGAIKPRLWAAAAAKALSTNGAQALQQLGSIGAGRLLGALAALGAQQPAGLAGEWSRAHVAASQLGEYTDEELVRVAAAGAVLPDARVFGALRLRAAGDAAVGADRPKAIAAILVMPGTYRVPLN